MLEAGAVEEVDDGGFQGGVAAMGIVLNHLEGRPIV